MESKLEQLLNRFESLVNRFEQASSTGNNEVSASVSGSTNTSTSSVPKIIKEFDNEIFPKIKVLEEAATNLGGDVIQTITKEYVKMILSQRDILQTMSQAKKPADFKFLILPVSKAKNDVRALKNKDLKMQNHVQTVADGFDLFAWFAQSDIKDTLEELLKQIDFYGFKVLQLKQENDTVWYKAYKDLAKTFVDFIADRADKAVQWTGSNDNAEEVFQSQLQIFRGGAPATTSQIQQIEEVKQQTGNLFADITSGQTMNQNLVHVEKNAHKKDGSALQPIVKKEIVPKTAVGAKVEVKKDPKTEFKMNTYYIEHYGKETLKYEGDQIESNYAFAMIKCKDTNLVQLQIALLMFIDKNIQFICVNYNNIYSNMSKSTPMGTSSKYQNLDRITIISLGFFFLFVAFNSAANLSAQIMNNDGFEGLGFYTMAMLYLFYLIFAFCSFLSAAIVNKIGTKVSLVTGGLCYFFWVFCFLAPAFKNENPHSTSFIFNKNFITFISLFSAAINGFGAGILWVAQGQYLSDCASDANKGFFFSYFWAFFMSSQILGNLTAALIL